MFEIKNERKESKWKGERERERERERNEKIKHWMDKIINDNWKKSEGCLRWLNEMKWKKIESFYDSSDGGKQKTKIDLD